MVGLPALSQAVEKPYFYPYVKFTIISTIDKRKLMPFRYYGSGSPFEYERIRMLYTKKRELETAH